jgi:hypothetical protein
MVSRRPLSSLTSLFKPEARDDTVSEVFESKVGSVKRHQTFLSDLKVVPYAVCDFVLSA